MPFPSTPFVDAGRSEDSAPNFRSLFFEGRTCRKLRVPDYQRAYAWETKHVDLFLRDLVQHQASGTQYYFGHFIAETSGDHWELVDGQQRITTFLLFLAVCRVRLVKYAPEEDAFSLIDQFTTVSYDAAALATMLAKLPAVISPNGIDHRTLPTEKQIEEVFDLSKGVFTRSQHRLALALLHINQAFERGELIDKAIPNYIHVVLNSNASCHLAHDKSVAVKIFEMHNSRGVRLTTMEIVKAKLMKCVFEHGGRKQNEYVAQIQKTFGEIFALEEALAVSGFRGEMTTDHLLRLHLRVVDDGGKREADQFDKPASNANEEDMIAYVDAKLRATEVTEIEGNAQPANVRYALALARELHTSIRIVTKLLPAWASVEPLVGDVMIQDRDLSCQWFLIICRHLETASGAADGRVSTEILGMWERLLFTRDFHDRYHNLKGTRDDFSKLFAAVLGEGGKIADVLRCYLQDGFRSDRNRTTNLQQIVADYLRENEPNILNNAFYWWRHKMIYALYKYESSRGAVLRPIMQEAVSVEHILPQEWKWAWLPNGEDTSEEDKEIWLKKITTCIHGMGNLLLVTPQENTRLGNGHPADKRYRYEGGSYKEHDQDSQHWRNATNWQKLIEERGKRINAFILSNLVGVSLPGAGQSDVAT